MAELNINGRMLVKNFKRQFKEVFGASLRVYKGQNYADDNLTLAAIRAEGCKGGELTLRANMLVGNFEDKMQELFGIKVQVADADDKKLVDNGLTLGAVGRGEVKKKVEKPAGSPRESESNDNQKQETNNNNQINSIAMETTNKKLTLNLSVDSCYRINLIPIVGEESNEMADEMIGNGEVDYGMADDIECSLCGLDLGDYRLCYDFYKSDEGPTWTADGDTLEGIDENSLEININKGWFEEDEIEPDDNFKLIDKLTKEAGNDEDTTEFYNNIMARHNEGVDDEHVDIIKDAICCRMRQVAEKLAEEGLIDNPEEARFILQFGEANCCEYSFDITVDGDFNPEHLHTLNCEEWNDCNGLSEVMFQHWPDRSCEFVIYGNTLYHGTCEGSEGFNYQADIVNCDLESLM